MPCDHTAAAAYLAAATEWEVGYSSQIVRGKTSRAVSGMLTPTQALQTILARSGIRVRLYGPSCLIPRFDGALLSWEWKEALWAKFVTEAPRPRTPSERQYNDRTLRPRH